MPTELLSLLVAVESVELDGPGLVFALFVLVLLEEPSGWLTEGVGAIAAGEAGLDRSLRRRPAACGGWSGDGEDLAGGGGGWRRRPGGSKEEAWKKATREEFLRTLELYSILQ